MLIGNSSGDTFNNLLSADNDKSMLLDLANKCTLDPLVKPNTPKNEAVNTSYVDTKLSTKQGEFNLRVYASSQGKETLVLWAKLISSAPVLVRVHSECITGDMIGSLHCDCGEQFKKSLQLISKEGGILIYLRQEGRGIGLFEKMKTYDLQSQGYDTSEANIMLGHRPDERTYEMVQTVLKDLNVQQIRLLTNNPSKISEINKFGIEVVERIPLIIKSNKHNKKYYKCKKEKFQHLYKKELNYYFYQFHAETSDHVVQIADFLKTKKLDPLLKICIGITFDCNNFRTPKEIDKVKSIFKTSNNYNLLVPVIHCSFINSKNVIDDINYIHKELPFINRIQLNDLPTIDLEHIKHACQLFQVDLPLCDDNFDIIYNKKFRDLVKKNKTIICLDNSKGKGIQESKAKLMEKVNILLGYGINNIGIYGGFGPNELKNYFEIRRYFRINFSIDAETKLKTNGEIDVEKIKLYLNQLFRFDDPKHHCINQTRDLLEKSRRTNWELARIHNFDFLIHPNVFHCGIFPATKWFASLIQQNVKDHTHFCEIGCGAGAISCLTAISNPQIQVVASDINQYACMNTKINAERLDVSDRVKVAHGDVFDSIGEGLFDSIFWLLPFGFLDPGANITLEEAQVFDPGYRSIRKFFQTAKQFLKPNGKLLIGFSTDLGHQDLISELSLESNLKIESLSKTKLIESNQITFEFLVGTYF